METSEKELLEQAMRRQQAKPAIAKERQQRRNQPAGGALKSVRGQVHVTNTVQAAERKEAQRPPERRWQRAYALPSVVNPPGYSCEWVRRDNRNRGDHENLIAHLSEGWEFARKEDFPGQVLPTRSLSDYGSVLGNDSSILMKIPDAVLAQRNHFYNSRRDRATREINNPTNAGASNITHPAMPIVEDVNKEVSGIYRNRVPRKNSGVADDT